MNKILDLSIAYFQAPEHYFWQWAENGEVIEWKNHTTICYRQELINILEGLSEYGAPPLGVILLILSACQEKWQKNNAAFLFVLEGIIAILDDRDFDTNNNLLKYYLNQAMNLLEMITKLPAYLKTGESKVSLIFSLFSDNHNSLSSGQLKTIKDSLGSGILDSFLLKKSEEISRKQFETDLGQIQKVLGKFSNERELELYLKTGLTNLPKKADIDIPENQTTDLLEELSKNQNTAGISNLAKRLVAVIDIPMFSKGSSDQSIGGFSDITNRGSFDRLLPSELAQDDLLLTARLINNESLYFRREEPPSNSLRSKTVLIDSTIKMWGIPKVFAISAALACIQNNDKNITVNSYGLGSDDYQQFDLSNKEGITDLLQYQDVGLDCTEALQSFMQNNSKELTDYILITDSELISTPKFQHIFSELKKSLNFLITVNRNGELHFHQFLNGNAKLLNSSRLDLEELLFSNPKATTTSNFIPAFMIDLITPLYLPTNSNVLDKNFFDLKSFGCLTVTDQQNVLYWAYTNKGPVELIEYIDSGQYYFGFNNRNIVYIMVISPKVVKFYKIGLNKYNLKITDFTDKIDDIIDVAYNDNYFYIKTVLEIITINCNDSTIFERKKYTTNDLENQKFDQLSKEFKNSRIVNYNISRDYIHYGYNVLKKARNVFINEEGHISLDNYSLVLKNQVITLVKTPDNEKMYLEDQAQLINLSSNPKIKFYNTVWEDGSQAIIDSRSLLHLKSSDNILPEVTILLNVANGSKDVIACWASNGVVCGNQYFYPDDEYRIIPEIDFYNLYIQSFIDKLI